MRVDTPTFPSSRNIICIGSAGPGYYSIPGATVGGIALTPAANAYGAYVTVTAGEPKPFFIVGILALPATVAADVSYVQIGLGIGAAPEAQISEFKLYAIDFVTSVAETGYPAVMLPFPIPVAGGVRVAARAALGAGTTTVSVSLIAIAQSDLIVVP